MKRGFNLNFLIVLVMLFALSCSWESNKKSREQSCVLTKAINDTDTSFLVDKNFVYRNLTSTVNVTFADKIEKVNAVDISVKYTDTTFKRKYFMLSGDQAGFLIAPFLPKGYGVNYVKHSMWIWLVSKQKKIGDLRPIIVLEVGKADFEALTLVILDKNNKPVSDFFLDEGNPFNGDIGGQQTQNNYSRFHGNQIISYRITEYTNSAIGLKIIDSNVFKTFIAVNGIITTKQIVKSHIVKRFE